MERDAKERHGIEWNGMGSNEIGWDRMEMKGMGWNGMK